MSESKQATHATYSFGSSQAIGFLLGIPANRVIPPLVAVVAAAMLWQAGLWWLSLIIVGAVLVAVIGRWKGELLLDVASPALRGWCRARLGRRTWTSPAVPPDTKTVRPIGGGKHRRAQRKLVDGKLPPALGGIELLSVHDPRSQRSCTAVVYDRTANVVSMVVRLSGEKFAVASRSEQDGLIARWGAALSPLARAGCPVSRLTWTEWVWHSGLAEHREFLTGQRVDGAHREDYERLIALRDPWTMNHEVLFTVSVGVQRVRRRRGRSLMDVAIDVLGEETSLLCDRFRLAGLQVDGPLSTLEVSTAVRMRSDPGRVAQAHQLRRSLAAAAGVGGLEWGPMAVIPAANHVTVDGSLHRTYRFKGLPQIPVPGAWMAPLLSSGAATRAVTVVMDPIGIDAASRNANMELTSMEASHAVKVRQGFRLTAREARRKETVEQREKELAVGHAEFLHAGLVTVSASSLDALDDAAGTVEQLAAQAGIDVRPLVAQQVEGWVASLPLGRSIRVSRFRR
jgi:hypothetical protein